MLSKGPVGAIKADSVPAASQFTPAYYYSCRRFSQQVNQQLSLQLEELPTSLLLNEFCLLFVNSTLHAVEDSIHPWSAPISYHGCSTLCWVVCLFGRPCVCFLRAIDQFVLQLCASLHASMHGQSSSSSLFGVILEGIGLFAWIWREHACFGLVCLKISHTHTVALREDRLSSKTVASIAIIAALLESLLLLSALSSLGCMESMEREINTWNTPKSKLSAVIFRSCCHFV